jgi:hypothetical protein
MIEFHPDEIADFRKDMLSQLGEAMARDEAVAMLREVAEEEKRPGKHCDKIHRDAFLYDEPQEECPDFGQCGTCFFFTGAKCFLHGDEIMHQGMSCGLYTHSEPQIDLAGMELPLITPEQSGLVDRAVRCENCRHFDAEDGDCDLYEKLNAAMPGAFCLQMKVSPRGCCNAQTPKTARIELSLAIPVNGTANGQANADDAEFYRTLRDEVRQRAKAEQPADADAASEPVGGEFAKLRAAQRRLDDIFLEALARAARRKQDSATPVPVQMSLSDGLKDLGNMLAERQDRAIDRLSGMLVDALSRIQPPAPQAPPVVNLSLSPRKIVTTKVIRDKKTQLVKEWTQIEQDVTDDGESVPTEPSDG